MNTLSLSDAVQRPAGHLSRLSSAELFVLKRDAVQALSNAKAVVEHLDRALELKYADRAQRLRLEAGKDTGAVTFVDDEVKVTADLPKRVEWDQDELAAIVERIRAAGQDPAEFVEASYRVTETKYNAWPAAWRETFARARVLRCGRPSFRMALATEPADQS